MLDEVGVLRVETPDMTSLRIQVISPESIVVAKRRKQALGACRAAARPPRWPRRQRIVLLSVHEMPYVNRQYKGYFMAKLFQLPAPTRRGPTSFHRDHAWWNRHKKLH